MSGNNDILLGRHCVFLMIRQKSYPSIRKKLWGGAPIAVIRQYIEQQQTPQ
jgi:hypothetical protein